MREVSIIKKRVVLCMTAAAVCFCCINKIIQNDVSAENLYSDNGVRVEIENAEPGTVYDEQANPIMVKGLFEADNTDIEILSALTTDRNRLFLILMNSTPRPQHTALTVHPAAIAGRRIGTASADDPATGRKITPGGDGAFGITLPGYGIQTLKFDLEP